MANREQLDLFKQGVDVWNQWRGNHQGVSIDLSGANLAGVDFIGADLIGADLRDSYLSRVVFGVLDPYENTVTCANLCNANLSGATMDRADLSFLNLNGANLHRVILNLAALRHATFKKADLSRANLYKADLSEADLGEANLSGARLREANLSEANLSGANLSGADLTRATLVQSRLINANLTDCFVYGVSVWNVQLEGAIQSNLLVTPPYHEPKITVDDLEVAQFIHLLLSNKKLRNIIDTITSKVVLILGRFTSERKAVLDIIRDELRKQNYTPVLFDFDKPASRDLTETVSILAHLARFIVIDLTDPSSAPHEAATIIPHCAVPVQPLLLQEPLMVDGKAVERREYAMFEDLRRRYHWVLPTFRYQDTAELLVSLQAQIITPAELKVKELMQLK